MENMYKEKRAEFVQRLKVSKEEMNKTEKRDQFSSNNKNNNDSDSDNKGEAPARGKSLEEGRGNER